MHFSLSGKVIYIISPERWGKMRLSKHHYALEMALRGNHVYFIEPPSFNNKRSNLCLSSDHDLLHIFSYKPIFRGKRFLPASLYRMFLRWQIKLIKKKIGKNPDVVLSFHPFLFEQLNWFGADHTIYFAADQFYQDYLPPEVFSSDFCLAVSDSIYDRVSSSGKQVYFIQHGLNTHFAKLARRILEDPQKFQKKISDCNLKVGYTGNLLMGGMDRQVMRKIIETHPDVRFIFWGQYDLAGGNFSVGLNEDITGFVEFLQSCSNVELRGVVDPNSLSREMQEADVFWICAKIGAGKIWDGSNSHKLLEYLSTGKPVVSHYVSSYKDYDVLDMLRDVSNNNYPELFDRVLNRVRTGESLETVKKRINFALSNTYEQQINRIESWINERKKV